jgi:hypothetical protein
MNFEFYRKYYLEENWGENRFIAKLKKISPENYPPTVYYRRNHPLVLSGIGFWINFRELCIGYELSENSEIFRPIFSHNRQILLDELNTNIHDGYVDKFWNKIKSGIWNALVEIRKLPVDCIENIITYI